MKATLVGPRGNTHERCELPVGKSGVVATQRASLTHASGHPLPPRQSVSGPRQTDRSEVSQLRYLLSTGCASCRHQAGTPPNWIRVAACTNPR